MTGQQLKNSILQMAVQGKLAPQDPNDEPASVLLERIRAEKEQLIKDGKIKKEKNPSVIFRGADNLPYEKIGKNEPVCIADEVPFEIPESWEWVRLGNVIELQSGQDMTTDKYNSNGNGIPYITGASNIENGKVLINRWTNCGRAFAYKGDILLTCKGTVGTMAVLQESQVHIARQIMAIRPIGELYVSYIQLVLQTLVESLKATAKSMIPGIARDDVLQSLFPVPPFNEQQRIVRNFSTIIPYMEQYSMVDTELSSLNSIFPETLKKSILQEAIQGKLVPQDPPDEPASVLLERIRAEKERLIQEGKIKRDKHESVIYRRDNSHYEKCGSDEVCIDEELPFEIPDNWEWVKLSDLAQFIGGYAYKSETFIKKSEYQVLRLGNVKNDEIRYSAKPVFISKELAEKTADFRCKPNDILLTMTGTRLKRDYFYTVAVSNKDTNCFVNQRVGCLREYYPNIYKWLIWVLKSEGILSQVFKYETGTANQGNLGAENIMKTFIPLPPLNEQNRICNMIECLLKKTSAL